MEGNHQGPNYTCYRSGFVTSYTQNLHEFTPKMDSATSSRTYRWRPFSFIWFSPIFFPLSISTSIICLTKWLCSNAGHSKATEVQFARIHRHSSPSQTVNTLKGHLVFLPRQPGASPTVLYDHINPFKGLCPICIAVDEMKGWEPVSPEEPDKRREKAVHSNRLPVLHH